MSDVRIDWGALEHLDDRAERMLQDGLRKIAFGIVGRTVQLLFAQGAVDTGNLAGSYHVVEGVLIFWVVTGVDYAEFVEYGTHLMEARPALTPARMQYTPLLTAMVGAVLVQAAKGG